MKSFQKAVAIAVIAFFATALIIVFLPVILLILLFSFFYAVIAGRSIRHTFLNFQTFRHPHHREGAADQEAKPFQRPAPDETVYDIDCKVLNPEDDAKPDADSGRRMSE